MMTQAEHAQYFQNLHIKGDPLILFNAWDAGSAQAIQESGLKPLQPAAGQLRLPMDMMVKTTL
jgi:2-methylisocitrate lyase-like PEP mutase family enzyme